MGMLRRQVLTAALVANTIRPLPGFRAGLAAFPAGWLVGELAPHAVAATLVDVAVHARGPRRSDAAMALAALNVVGLGHVIAQSFDAQRVVEGALADALGADYQDRLDERPTKADLATPWRRLVNPFRMRNPRVRVERDIAYNDTGRRGLLDVYRPVGRELRDAPVLLQVHGGGWSFGNKDQQAIPLMQHMAERGWVCVAINYRLSPRDAFPAHVVDVKRALAWVKAHIADYGGDPGYVAVTGGSAGGHLAALAALTPGRSDWQPGFEDVDTSVRAAVPHYGVYDFAGSTGLRRAEQMRDRFLAPRILQRRWADDPEAFEDASPILQVTAGAPDFFVIHGTHDSLVGVEQARLFVQHLKEVSDSSVVYAELPGAQHAFDVLPSIRSAHVVRAIDRYLHWHWSTWRAGLDHEDQLTADSQEPGGSPGRGTDGDRPSPVR